MSDGVRERHRKLVRFTALKWFGRVELQEIAAAISHAERSLKAGHRDLEAEWERAKEELGGGDLDQVSDQLAEEYQRISDVFPQTFRQALFILTLAAVEQHQDRVALLLREHLRLSEDLADSRGQGLRRSKNYLKAAGVAFPDQDHPWRALLDYGKLRNHLVHSGFFVEEGDDRVNTFKQLPGLYFEAKGRIVLGEAFLDEVLGVMHAHLQTLHDAVMERAASGA